MSSNVRQLESITGHEFADKSLARMALTHRSSGPVHNERLEFLGDAILGFTVAEMLFSRFPEASEGELSRMRSAMVNRDTLAAVARQLKLGELLVLGPGELNSGGRQRASILSNAVEAVIGAIYLDAGLEACRSMVLRLLEDHVPDPRSTRTGKDAKTQLQEVLQAEGAEVPVYKVVSVSGEAHQQTFAVSCSLSLLAQETQGTGSSRRNAEQQAALAALKLLGADQTPRKPARRD